MDLIAFRSSTESCKMTISSNGLVDVPPVSVYVVVGADGSFWKVSCSGSNVREPHGFREGEDNHSSVDKHAITYEFWS